MRWMVMIVLGLMISPGVTATALAQERTITLDFSRDRPTRLPPPREEAGESQITYFAQQAPQPQPIIAPAAPAPAPQPFTPAQTPSGYCPVDCCADGSYVWLSAEYLFWWVRSQPLPPLVTASAQGTPRAVSGVLDQPTTTVLVGSGGVNGDVRSGWRINAGFWIDECHTFGVQASYFRVGSQQQTWAISSVDMGQVVRPFVNVLTGRPSAEQVGSVAVTSYNDGLRGANVLLRENCYGAGDHCAGTWMRLDLLAGYAFFGIEEGLLVSEIVAPDPAASVLAGSRTTVQDSFRTRNEFNGGQFGVSAQRRYGVFSWQIDALLAMGVTSQTVLIDGNRTTTTPGVATVATAGGLLAQVSNVGLHRRDRFSVVPQARFEVGCHLSERVRLSMAYNFLFWTGVVRPGDQVDLGVNPNLIPPAMLVGPSRPAFSPKGGDLWAQGLTFGLEFSY